MILNKVMYRIDKDILTDSQETFFTLALPPKRQPYRQSLLQEKNMTTVASEVQD